MQHTRGVKFWFRCAWVIGICGSIFLADSHRADAASYSWLGIISTDWGVAGNWSPAVVPGAGDSVTIGTGAAVTISYNCTVASLSLGVGSSIQGSGNVTVTTLSATDASIGGTGTVSLPAGGVANFTGLVLGTTVKKKIINSGTMHINGNANFAADVTNNPGATFDVQTDANLSYTGTTAPTFTNAGTFLKSGGLLTTTLQFPFTNSGTISVRSGTLNVGANFSQTGGSTNLDGGNLAGSGTLAFNGGTLGGSGVIAGNVANSARMSPGHSPGTITINGNYTQSSTATLDMEIGGTSAGTQYDQLIVNGTASLNGTLNIIQYNGFVPSAGTNFQIINYYSENGNFSVTNRFWTAAKCYFNTVPTSTYYVATCYLDSTPPALSVTTPIADRGYASLSTVTGTASDAGSGLALPVTVVLYRYAVGKTAAGYWAGGTSWTTSYSAASNERPASGTTNWSLSLPSLATGQYYVRATAKDNVGNTTVGPNTSFWIDSTAPASVTFTAPAASAYINNLNSVSGTAADNSGGSGIARVDLLIKRSDGNYWNGSGWSTTSTPLGTVVSGTTWSRSTAMPGGANLSNGAYTLTATAYDKTGNSKVASISCTVDTALPTISVTAPVNNTMYSSLSSTTGTAADTGGSGLSTIKVLLYRYGNASTAAGYWAGSSTWTATYSAASNERAASGTTSWSLTLPTLAYGQYIMHATAWDKASNATTSANVIFWKSSGTSTVSYSTGSASASGGSIVLNFAGALDATIASDLSRYTVTVNGAPVQLQSASFSSTTYRLTLTVPSGSMAVGSSIAVTWNNLFDTTGKILSGKTGTLTAQ